MKKLVLAVTLACSAATVSGAKDPKALTKALLITPADAASATVVKDDDLETVATFSTEPVFQNKQGLLGIVSDDNYLRAFVDKKTGKTVYQVVQKVVYEAPSWRMYGTVNYEAPDGTASEDLTKLNSDVSCSGSRYSGCTYYETVGFDLDESLARQIASAYSPGLRAAWQYRLKAQLGTDWNDGILPAEAAGLIQRVDAYKQAHSLP